MTETQRPYIDVFIGEDGTLLLVPVGFADCLAATRGLEEALGLVQSRQAAPDLRQGAPHAQAQPQHQEQRQ